READIWAILTLNPPVRRGPFFLRGVARLRPGLTLEQANREMDALGTEVERADPKRVERVRYPVTCDAGSRAGAARGWPKRHGCQSAAKSCKRPDGPVLHRADHHNESKRSKESFDL